MVLAPSAVVHIAREVVPLVDHAVTVVVDPVACDFNAGAAVDAARAQQVRIAAGMDVRI